MSPFEVYECLSYVKAEQLKGICYFKNSKGRYNIVDYVYADKNGNLIFTNSKNLKRKKK